MKCSMFSRAQIVSILKEAEAGIPVEELSRKHGFSKSACYRWKAKYSGMTWIFCGPCWRCLPGWSGQDVRFDPIVRLASLFYLQYPV
jgi:putative transposase